MICTRCDGTGFLNVNQLPDEIADENHENILQWIEENPDTDVEMCDCCSNGDDWYGVPGEHYGVEDPEGKYGPYAYNGGLCECD
jgi:hypothetical protein